MDTFFHQTFTFTCEYYNRKDFDAFCFHLPTFDSFFFLISFCFSNALHCQRFKRQMFGEKKEKQIVSVAWSLIHVFVSSCLRCTHKNTGRLPSTWREGDEGDEGERQRERLYVHMCEQATRKLLNAPQDKWKTELMERNRKRAKDPPSRRDNKPDPSSSFLPSFLPSFHSLQPPRRKNRRLI